jgi:phage-related tail fiber protein
MCKDSTKLLVPNPQCADAQTPTLDLRPYTTQQVGNTTTDAATAAKDKAVEMASAAQHAVADSTTKATHTAGDVLEQAGDAVINVFNTLRNTVIPHGTTTHEKS